MYSDLNLAAQPQLTGTVVRGYIMRYESRSEWPARLVALPPGIEAQDADAVSHYRRKADGLFYEYTGWAPSTAEDPIYVLAEDFLPPPASGLVATGAHFGDVRIYRREESGLVRCPSCGSSTVRLEVRGREVHCCADELGLQCEMIFVLAAEEAPF